MPRARVPAITEGPSTGYGDEAALQASLDQVPMVTPDEVPNLNDPTSRPTEPVTTGLPYGPGAGPEAMGPGGVSDDPVRTAL